MPDMTGYAFPNDIHIGWTLMVVLYPYLTGLVAGAFICSSLYHVFGRKELAPIARISLVVSACFLAVAPLPLLIHLGHPERAFNVLITPNFESAMAGFGIVFGLYLVLVMLEIYFVFRKDIILRARRSRGPLRWILAAVALFTYDISEEALAVDEKIVRVLAGVGIPAACLLHGYVGFIFGALKSNPWWSTPLMPIIFLFSAVVSGIALLIVLYQIAMRFRGTPIDQNCLRSMAGWLWLFLIVTFSLEMLEVITLAYERSEEWEVIGYLLSHQLSFSFISVQVVAGSLIPLILLMVVVLMSGHMKAPLLNMLTFVASGLLLMQVFSMRWNVVIGGQMFSKSLRGFRLDYVPEFFEKEGTAVAIVICIVPFLLLLVADRLLPLWSQADAKAHQDESS
ncbi:MAG: polysulfide reductase NrfD [Deltaproteobacteria bacterium]|nr:polysulfide reductase NrfD [Deltaproteobacteria bacterium]